MCAKLLLLWQNEECVQSFCYCGELKSVCKAFVIVENEECVQSFCYCGK